MKLVIAEKPSVAKTYAAALGVKERKDGYFAGETYLISWCIGHLAGLADAELYDAKYREWKLEELPILPESWRFIVHADKQKKFDTLCALMARDDVTEIVNACDAGREGELIFRIVYELSGCRKPIQRLWLSSMEDEAIRQGFRSLQDGRDYENLYQAALCRAKADWLVGINATRFFTLLYHRKLKVGRVMSPTLAMLVQREAEVRAFVPEPFFTVQLDLNSLTVVGEKLKSKQKAAALAGQCKGKAVTVQSVTQKGKTEVAPRLYDLTSLQREANTVLGYTAQQTLDYTQSLYEKKLCTYPRTDSRFLTDDMAASVPAIAAVSASLLGLDSISDVNASQVCNSKKVSDHHAIVPTSNATKKAMEELPGGEREILTLIAGEVLRAVSGPHKYAETVAEIMCADTSFSAKGRTVREPGWKLYAVRDQSSEDKAENPDRELPKLTKGQELPVKAAKVKEGKTSPPKPFTEDTLLSSMETAGAKETPDDAERKGLGTPATRAGIIEKLVSCGYIDRKKAKKITNLLPTDSGKAVITVLPEDLQSPLLTAEWEQRLKQVERGKVEPERFLAGIIEMVKEIISGYTAPPGANTLFPKPELAALGRCPRCGKSVVENTKGFVCEDRSCGFAMWKKSRFFSAKGKTFTAEIAKKLLEHGEVKLTGCKSESSGRTYDCKAILVDDGKTTDYRIEFLNRKQGGRSQ